MNMQLKGQTGRIIELDHKFGKLKMSNCTISFASRVVTLSDGSKPTFSLLDHFKVGDSVHFDGVVIAGYSGNNSFGGIATKVWPSGSTSAKKQVPAKVQQPKPKTITANKQGSATPANSPKKLMGAEKVLRSTIRKLINGNKGSMTIEDLQCKLLSLGPEVSSVYGFSSNGLKEFIAARPAKFVLKGNTVTVKVKQNKPKKVSATAMGAPLDPVVQQCVEFLRRILTVRGFVSLTVLNSLVVTEAPKDVYDFIGPNLKEFIIAHSEDFLLFNNGVVHVIDKPEQNQKNLAKVTLSKAEKKRLEVLTVNLIKGNLTSSFGTYKPLRQLALDLTSSNFEVTNFLGVPLESQLRNLLERHKDVFQVMENDMVYLVPEEPVARNASIAYLRAILEKSNPMTIARLLGNLEQASPLVRDHIGQSVAHMTKFLQSNRNVFQITDGNLVRLIIGPSADESTEEPGEQIAPQYYRGVIQFLSAKFGFIQNGILESENIFFDLSSCLEMGVTAEMPTISNVLHVGDIVDCLYKTNKMRLDNTNRAKYRAIALWKTQNGTEDIDGLLPITSSLPSPVLFGEATVTYFSSEIGYCLVQGTRKDKPICIFFHLKHIQFSDNLKEQLKTGSTIRFVAQQIPSGKSISSMLWKAIAIWSFGKIRRKKAKSMSDLSLIGTSTLSETQQLSWVIAKLIEVTNEGGTVSFGKDAYAHRAMFTWEKVLLDELLIGKVVTAYNGDDFWCTVKKGASCDSTKYVVSHMMPVAGSNGIMPAKFSELPALETLEAPPLIDFAEDGTSGGHSILDDSGSSDDASDCDDTLSNCSSLLASGGGKNAAVAKSSSESDSGDIDGDLAQLLAIIFKTSDNSNNELDISDGIGTIEMSIPNGGMVETEDGSNVFFGAHTFFHKDVPISHMAYRVGTRVRLDAKRDSNGMLFAVRVHCDSKPRI